MGIDSRRRRLSRQYSISKSKENLSQSNSNLLKETPSSSSMNAKDILHTSYEDKNLSKNLEDTRSDDIDLTGMSAHKTHSFERKKKSEKNKLTDTENSVDVLCSGNEQNV